MLTKDANTELMEYDIISALDKKEVYHLGKPIHCKVDPNPANMSAIRRCKKGSEYLKNPDVLSLLIMNDGGENVEQFSERFNTQGSQELAEHFWIDFYNVLLAVDLFDKKGIVHHDMKPQNIMYNATTREMKIIDFGLMTTADKIKNSAENSKYPFPIIHWSFPFELFLYNKKTYDTFTSHTKPRAEFFKNLINKFHSSSTTDNDANNIKTFFNYMRVDGYSDSYNNDIIKKYWKDFYFFLVNLNAFSHEDFIKMSHSTIDIYGAGIAVASAFSATNKYLDVAFSSRIADFMYAATHPVVAYRLTPKNAVAEYKSMLESSGLLSKYGISLDTEKLPESVHKGIDSIQLDDIALNRTQIDVIVNKPMTGCPIHMEMNPKTGRCNKRCKDGYIRNADFKCVSSGARVNAKICPSGKEMNPKTRRCNNVCKNGYERDSSFKCVPISKNKTQKRRH